MSESKEISEILNQFLTAVDTANLNIPETDIEMTGRAAQVHKDYFPNLTYGNYVYMLYQQSSKSENMNYFVRKLFSLKNNIQYTFRASCNLLETEIANYSNTLSQNAFENYLSILLYINTMNSEANDINPKRSGFILRQLYEKSDKSVHTNNLIDHTLTKWFTSGEQRDFLFADGYTVENLPELFYTHRMNALCNIGKAVFNNDSSNPKLAPLLKFAFSISGFKAIKAQIQNKCFSDMDKQAYSTIRNLSIYDLKNRLDSISSEPETRLEAVLVLIDMVVMAQQEDPSYQDEQILLLNHLKQEFPSMHDKYQVYLLLDQMPTAEELLSGDTYKMHTLPTFE